MSVGDERRLRAQPARRDARARAPARRSTQPILAQRRAREPAPGRLDVFKARTLDITWPVAEGAAGLERRRSSGSAREADEALADGVNILILSDRNLGADRVADPGAARRLVACTTTSSARARACRRAS